MPDIKCNAPDDCPNGVSCCVLYGCAKHNGFWIPFERDRFTKDENEKIDACWDDKDGYLGTNGCRLPRELMPITCLSHIRARNLLWTLSLPHHRPGQ